MQNKTYACPFCKDVLFFTPQDLEAHLKAGIRQPPPCNCPAINERDHLNHYQNLHKALEYGQPEDYA